jgi:nitrous oxide reductase accessory protein NosL
MKNRIIYGAVFMTLILAACSKKDNTVVLPTTVKTKDMTVNFSPNVIIHFF